jgi:hypothetical protein
MITNADEPHCRAFPTQGTGRPKTADTPVPEIALLSNGQYSVMITAAGAGTSSWRDLDVAVSAGHGAGGWVESVNGDWEIALGGTKGPGVRTVLAPLS